MTRVEFPSHLDKEEVRQSQLRLETRMKNLWAAYPSLLEKYPDQWILWDGEERRSCKRYGQRTASLY